MASQKGSVRNVPIKVFDGRVFENKNKSTEGDIPENFSKDIHRDMEDFLTNRDKIKGSSSEFSKTKYFYKSTEEIEETTSEKTTRRSAPPEKKSRLGCLVHLTVSRKGSWPLVPEAAGVFKAVPAKIYPEAKETTTSESKTATKMGTKETREEEDDDMRDPRSGRLRKSTYTVSTPTLSSLGQVQGKLEESHASLAAQLAEVRNSVEDRGRQLYRILPRTSTDSPSRPLTAYSGVLTSPPYTTSSPLLSCSLSPLSPPATQQDSTFTSAVSTEQKTPRQAFLETCFPVVVQQEQGARRRGPAGKEQGKELGKPRSQVPLIVNKNRGWVRELDAKKEDVDKDPTDVVNDRAETKQRSSVENVSKPNLNDMEVPNKVKPETKPLIIGYQDRIGLKNQPHKSEKEMDIEKHSHIEFTIIEKLEELREEKIKKEETCVIRQENIQTGVTVPLLEERKSPRERYPKDMRKPSNEGKDDAQDKHSTSLELNKLKYLRNDRKQEKIKKVGNSDDIEVGQRQERQEFHKQQGTQSRRARKDSSVLRATSNSVGGGSMRRAERKGRLRGGRRDTNPFLDGQNPFLTEEGRRGLVNTAEACYACDAATQTPREKRKGVCCVM